MPFPIRLCILRPYLHSYLNDLSLAFIHLYSEVDEALVKTTLALFLLFAIHRRTHCFQMCQTL